MRDTLSFLSASILAMSLDATRSAKSIWPDFRFASRTVASGIGV